MRKEFEKLVLGKDNNINAIERERTKQATKVDFSNLANVFSFDTNSGIFDASTGFSTNLLSLGPNRVVDRVFAKRDDEKIK